MKYSEYLTLVLQKYKKYPSELICQANTYVCDETRYDGHYLTLLQTLNRTFYGTDSDARISHSFVFVFNNYRKHNSIVVKKLTLFETDLKSYSNARIGYMIRFRTKYLEQLIRQAKIAESPQSSEINNLTNHDVIYYPDSESWLRVAELLLSQNNGLPRRLAYVINNEFGNLELWGKLLEYKNQIYPSWDKNTYNMTQDESINLALIMAAIQGEI